MTSLGEKSEIIKEIKERKGEFAPTIIKLAKGHQIKEFKVQRQIDSETGLNNIYVVQDAKNQEFALKVESKADKEPMLKTELHILGQMEDAGRDGKHFCKVYSKGMLDDYKYIVITLTGKSLQRLRKDAKDRRFTMGCGLSVAIQCLKSLEVLHTKGFIHRDVAPSNFSVGRAEAKEQRLIYCLDFGFASQYKTSDGNIKPKRDAPWKYRGALRYATRNCYKGEELSRMDDLEMWLYMVVEFCKGSLPWMNQKKPNEIYEWQGVARSPFGVRQLLGGLPVELIDVMGHIDSLGYSSNPDYNMLYGLLQSALCNNMLEEFPYDWESDKPQPLASTQVQDPQKTSKDKK